MIIPPHLVTEKEKARTPSAPQSERKKKIPPHFLVGNIQKQTQSGGGGGRNRNGFLLNSLCCISNATVLPSNGKLLWVMNFSKEKIIFLLHVKVFHSKYEQR